MPFSLKYAATGQLLACEQVNGYELPYYGIVLWEDEPSPIRIAEALALAGIAPGDPGGNLADWDAVELTEHQAKMANVKLRNDARRSVYVREGDIEAR